MQQNTHSVEIENRLTKVEIHQDEHKSILHDHSEALTDIRSQMITPRDIRMMIAGVIMIAGALLGKVPWQDVLTVLSKH